MPETRKEPLTQKWLVLDHLLKKLFKTHEVPREVIQNLQLSKTLINFYNDDPTDPERIKEVGKIVNYLTNTESTLMTIAEEEGPEFVEEWTQKLADASKGKDVFKPVKIQSNFFPNMPSNFDFARFNFKSHVPDERFYEICEYEGVIVEYDDNESSIFIYGEKPNITNAIKEMRSFYLEQMDGM